MSVFVPSDEGDAECVLEPSGSSVCLGSVVKCYKGKVTHVDPFLSMYVLDGKTEMCLAFLNARSLCPTLSEGQVISVYNAHTVTGKEGQKTLLLCSRSYVKCHTSVGNSPFSDKSLPLLACVSNSHYGYMDFPKFKEIRALLEETLSDYFLATLGVNDPQNVHARVIVLIITNLYNGKKGGGSEASVNDFLSSADDCIFSCEIPQLLTIGKCVNLPLKETKVNASYFWFSRTVPQSENESILVGYLEVCVATGSWTLADATHKVNCIISDPINKSCSVSGLLQINKRIVLVKNYTVVAEEFYVDENNSKVVHRKIYLYFTMNDVYCLCDPKSVMRSPFVPELESTEQSNIILDPDLNLHQCLNEGRRVMFNALLHQVSAVFRNHRDGLSKCCLYASVMGGVSKTLDDAVASDFTAKSRKRFIMVLKGDLLKLRPFLVPGNHYLIVLPPNYDRKDILTQSSGGRNVSFIPHCGFLHLPTGSDIRMLQNPSFGTIPLQDPYTVSGLKDVSHAEIITVEGYVCDRFHLAPKDRTVPGVVLPTFGTPGMKDVVLKLKDADGVDVVCLYVTDWAYSHYPLGMLVGAHICATFVKKIAINKNYLVSTSMTYVHILSLSPVRKIPRNAMENMEAILQIHKPLVPGSVFWAILSPNSFKVTLNVVCSSCDSPSINKCGCLGSKSVIQAKAMCTLWNLLGKLVLFFKDEQVRILLDIPQSVWDIVAEHLDETESKFTNVSFTEDDGRTLVHRVLQLYCSVVPQQQRFQVLCRVREDWKGKNKSCSGNPECTILYCLEIKKVKSDVTQRLCHTLLQQRKT